MRVEGRQIGIGTLLQILRAINSIINSLGNIQAILTMLLPILALLSFVILFSILRDIKLLKSKNSSCNCCSSNGWHSAKSQHHFHWPIQNYEHSHWPTHDFEHSHWLKNLEDKGQKIKGLKSQLKWKIKKGKEKFYDKLKSLFQWKFGKSESEGGWGEEESYRKRKNSKRF